MRVRDLRQPYRTWMRTVIKKHRQLKHRKCRRLRPLGVRNLYRDEIGVFCTSCSAADVLGLHALLLEPPDPRSWWVARATEGYPSVTILFKLTGLEQLHAQEIVHIRR